MVRKELGLYLKIFRYHFRINAFFTYLWLQTQTSWHACSNSENKSYLHNGDNIAAKEQMHKLKTIYIKEFCPC